MLTMLNHQNLLSCHGAITTDLSQMIIVLEYCQSGTLKSLLQNESIELDWKKRLAIAVQIAMGLSYLHDLHLVHCDMKSANVMIGEGFSVKIIDFGNARVVTKGGIHQALGTVILICFYIFV